MNKTRYKPIGAVLIALLMLLSACGRQPTEPSEAPAVSPLSSETAASLSGASALNFQTEADQRAFLAGTWLYTPNPNTNRAEAEQIALSIEADGNYVIQVTEPDGQDQVFEGNWTLTKWNENASDTLSDWLQMGYSGTEDERLTYAETCGDYRLNGFTLCDGEWLLRMFQVNNGDSVFSLWADDVAPVLRRKAEVQTTGATRSGETFLAVCWKADGAAGKLYLDDVALKDWKLTNDVKEALPYAYGETAAVYGPGATYPGVFCRATVNEEGAVTALEKLGVSLVENEEEAYMTLAEVQEIQMAMEQGQVPEATGEIVEIGGEFCAVYTLGGAWSGQYAVSAGGKAYWLGAGDQWEVLDVPNLTDPDRGGASGNSELMEPAPVPADPASDGELMDDGELLPPADPDDPMGITGGEAVG